MRFRYVFALTLIACGVSCGLSHVKGPDGKTDWFKVECRREGACLHKASAQCPKGFLIAESEKSESSTFYEKADAVEDNEGSLHTMIARCGKEDEEKRDEEDEPFKPIGKPKNLAACGRAYDKIDALAPAWLEWHPSADAPDKPPARSDFVNTCGDLPEEAQQCLSLKFLQGHEKDCRDVFDDLAPKLQVRLAKLFEKDGAHPAKMVLLGASRTASADDAGAPDLDAGAADAGKLADAGAPKKPGKGEKPAKVDPKKAADAGKPADDAGKPADDAKDAAAE